MTSKRDQAVLNAILNPFAPTEDFDSSNLDELRDDIEITDAVKKVKTLEGEAIRLAECGQLKEALEVVNKAIFAHPGLASLYNNRAQIYRLLGDDTGALQDLNEAIIISCGRGRSGCQALCQRGLIQMRRGNNEAAIADFTRASHLGNLFAKMQLVQINPYAALCNNMLAQVFEKVKKGSDL